MPDFPILECAEAIYVINLASRTDRRVEAESQLARLGLGFENPAVFLFPACRPEDAGEFPSIGAKGCFMSHLGVLSDARSRGLRSLLILEDDADFTSDFLALGRADFVALNGAPWDILYLGYMPDEGLRAPAQPNGLIAIAATHPVRQTHAMAIRESVIGALIEYLEAMLTRPSGHPDGGPMHVDGAYSWFRREHPEARTMRAAKPWAVQRASRTDVHGPSWKNRIPFVDFARRLRNRLRPT